MLVLISYDVSTKTSEGRRRLRQVAKTCEDYGIRVQNSVFECLVNPAQFVVLKQKLIDICDERKDSLRFYFLGSNWKRRVEHYGAKKTLDLESDPIIV